MMARTTLSGTEAMLNNFADQARSLKDPWEFTGEVQTQFDPDVLLSTIMLKGSDLQPVFTDPRMFYTMNRAWWKKWEDTFYKWFIVNEKEYEPLWDRNGFEEVHEDTYDVGTDDTVSANTEVVDDDTTYSKSGSSTEVMDDDTTNGSTTTENGTIENQVSAYDATDYQAHDKTIENKTTGVTGSGTDDRTTTNNWSESGSGTDDKTTANNGTVNNDTTNDRDFDRQYHSWGNWGISQTSQKLLMSEYEVRYWNLYEHMSDIFIDEMCVRVF